MVNVFEVVDRLKFWAKADRLGPDMPLTHWRLHFKSSMRSLCKSKFRYFGEGAEIRPGAYVIACSNVSLGKGVIIRPGSMLFASPSDSRGSIVIEDYVLVGSGVHFYTSNHAFSDPNIPIFDQSVPATFEVTPIIVRRGSWVGANVVILPGVEFGDNSVVGAGTIVTKSVPPRVVFAGNPGKVIRQIQ